LTPQVASVVNLRVEAKFDPNQVRSDIEDSVQHVEYHADPNKDGWILLGDNIFAKCIFWRGPITFSFRPNGVDATTRLYYWIEVVKNKTIHLVECGQNEPRSIDLALSSDFAWTPAWQYSPNTKFAKPVMDNPCDVSGLPGPLKSLEDALRKSVTKMIQDKLTDKLTDLQGRIDAKISEKTDFKGRVSGYWDSLVATMQLADDAWLQMNPDAVDVTSPDIDMTHGTVSFDVRIRLKPDVVLGKKPDSQHNALPTQTVLPAPSGLSLDTRVNLDYDELARQMSSSLGEKDSARFSDVAVYPSGNDIVVGVTVAKPKGTMFLKGTPAYQNGKLHLTSIDYIFQTRNLWARLVSGLFHSQAQDLIGSVVNVVLPLEFDNQRLKAENGLQKAANQKLSDHVSLETKNPAISAVDTPVLTETGIVLPLKLTGGEGTPKLVVIP
jgi:hypothetical protein